MQGNQEAADAVYSGIQPLTAGSTLQRMASQLVARVMQTGLIMSSTLMTFGACTDDIADQIVYAATRYATTGPFKLLTSAC